MANYSSDNINVFPTSRRGSNIDIQSKFNTEKNITSLVNRLTDIKSFVINGIIDNAHVITPLNTPNGTPTIPTSSVNVLLVCVVILNAKYLSVDFGVPRDFVSFNLKIYPFILMLPICIVGVPFGSHHDNGCQWRCGSE